MTFEPFVAVERIAHHFRQFVAPASPAVDAATAPSPSTQGGDGATHAWVKLPTLVVDVTDQSRRYSADQLYREAVVACRLKKEGTR